jgi:hypothetical protein
MGIGAGLGAYATGASPKESAFAGLGGAAIGAFGGGEALGPLLGYGSSAAPAVAGTTAAAAGGAGSTVSGSGGLGSMFGSGGNSMNMMLPAMMMAGAAVPGPELELQDPTINAETALMAEHAKEESFPEPRVMVQPPANYRPGVDPEHNYFPQQGYAEGGTVSGYAEGGTTGYDQNMSGIEALLQARLGFGFGSPNNPASGTGVMLPGGLAHNELDYGFGIDHPTIKNPGDSTLDDGGAGFTDGPDATGGANQYVQQGGDNGYDGDTGYGQGGGDGDGFDWGFDLGMPDMSWGGAGAVAGVLAGSPVVGMGAQALGSLADTYAADETYGNMGYGPVDTSWANDFMSHGFTGFLGMGESADDAGQRAMANAGAPVPGAIEAGFVFDPDSTPAVGANQNTSPTFHSYDAPDVNAGMAAAVSPTTAGQSVSGYGFGHSGHSGGATTPGVGSLGGHGAHMGAFDQERSIPDNVADFSGLMSGSQTPADLTPGEQEVYDFTMARSGIADPVANHDNAMSSVAAYNGTGRAPNSWGHTTPSTDAPAAFSFDLMPDVGPGTATPSTDPNGTAAAAAENAVSHAMASSAHMGNAMNGYGNIATSSGTGLDIADDDGLSIASTGDVAMGRAQNIGAYGPETGMTMSEARAFGAPAGANIGMGLSNPGSVAGINDIDIDDGVSLSSDDGAPSLSVGMGGPMGTPGFGATWGDQGTLATPAATTATPISAPSAGYATVNLGVPAPTVNAGPVSIFDASVTGHTNDPNVANQSIGTNFSQAEQDRAAAQAAKTGKATRSYALNGNQQAAAAAQAAAEKEAMAIAAAALAAQQGGKGYSGDGHGNVSGGHSGGNVGTAGSAGAGYGMGGGYGGVTGGEWAGGGYAEGGSITSAPEGPQEMQVYEAAKMAIRGHHPQPEQAIETFIQVFGQDAFQRLKAQVLSEGGQGGDGGHVKGPGTGRSDSVPATIDGKENINLSNGEFVIPEDVVSGLGGGSNEQGAAGLRGMMGQVRQASPQQPVQSQPPLVAPPRQAGVLPR